MGVGGPPNGWWRKPAASGVSRRAADLREYPKLVVICLGMRVYGLRGLLTVIRLRPEIHKAFGQDPDGLLFHEPFYFSLFPLHIGLRQYWRDFDSLERWTRSFPHQEWWKEFGTDREPVFGTKPTWWKIAWKESTTGCGSTWDCCNSLRRSPPLAKIYLRADG